MLSRLAKLAWAAPCSLVGLLVAVALLAGGGQMRRKQGALEVTCRPYLAQCHSTLRVLPFRGITLGHIIIAVTEEELEHLRAHEQVHVQQYERWGIFFFPAYLVSSLWQLIRGRRVYWDNYFEVQARRESRD